MNCRKGDLAIVLTEGEVVPRDAIVLCLEFLPVSYQVNRGEWVQDAWLIEWRGVREVDGVRLGRLDCELRPIRPRKGDDETLAWAGKPERVEA